MAAMIRCAAVIAALFFIALPARAQDVTLRAHAGNLNVSGTLLSYDGQVYRVDTAYGTLVVDALAVDCAGPGCPELALLPPRFRLLAEDAAMAGLLAALIRDFAATQGRQVLAEPDALALADAGGRVLARFALSTAPAAEARQRMARGGAELALVDAAPWPPEGRVLGHDGLVVAVAAANPLRQIALEDLAGVLAGEVTDWAGLGAPPAPIALHAPAPGTGARRLAEARLGPIGAGQAHDDPAALAAAVAGDPWALALLPARALRPDLAVLRLTDRCGALLDPEGFALRTGDYPLALALQLAPAGGRLHPVLRALRDHLGTASAQALVAGAGLADLTVQRHPAAEQGARLVNAIRVTEGAAGLAALQEVVAAMAGADRLSLSFRFAPGTARLDPASALLAADLGAGIAAGAHAGQDLLLAAFGDDARDAQALAGAALAAVEAAMTDPAPGAATLTTAAFGPALPLGCADTAAGRHLNRRVEVWQRLR